MLSGPIIVEADEYFEDFICPLLLDWIVVLVRLQKNCYSKYMMEQGITKDAMDPNSLGDFIDPITRGVIRSKWPKKVIHKCFVPNWIVPSFLKDTVIDTSKSISTGVATGSSTDNATSTGLHRYSYSYTNRCNYCYKYTNSYSFVQYINY